MIFEDRSYQPLPTNALTPEDIFNGQGRSDHPVNLVGRWMGEGVVQWGEFSVNCEFNKSKNDFRISLGDIVALELRFKSIEVFERKVSLKGTEVLKVVLLAPYKSGGSEFGPSNKIQTLHRWNEFLEAVRFFFRDRGFVEAHTPTLVSSTGLEPHLDPFVTRFEMGKENKTYFLPTSPEFHLKRMLSLGWRNIFEIKNCFRNGEVSDHHLPEFYMLEWYRGFSNLEAIKKDLKELIFFLCENLRWVATSCHSAPEFASTTMAQLFGKNVDFELSPQTTIEELRSLVAHLNLYSLPEDSWDELFHRIFLEKIEPRLPTQSPLIIEKFPPSHAALARLDSEGWADRFEFYWKGFEIANAYHELNDPVEQRRRFESEVQKKKDLGKAAVPLDEDLLTALETGFPPSGGIALGLDRLFMALTGTRNISETRVF